MMEKLSIKGTKKHPTVLLDPKKGLFEIRGNSIPEDAGKFYQPIMDALEEYFNNNPDNTIVNFKLVYYNSATSKWLLNLLKMIQNVPDVHDKVEIYWYYQEGDEEIYEAGLDYRGILGLPIQLIQEE